MPRILLLISAIPVIAIVVLTWWFGTRVLWLEGKRMCRCDLGKWTPDEKSKDATQRSEATARVFGIQVRNKALKHWKKNSPKLAKTRKGNRALGMVLPPFGGIIGVFLILTAKPILGLATFVAATAFAAIIGLFSLPSELTAVRRYIQSEDFKGSFPNSYDEEAVIACALAQVWESGLPPLLKWFCPGNKG